MNEFNLNSLLEIGKDASSSNLTILHVVGEFTVNGSTVRRVDNNKLETHSLIFPLLQSNGQPMLDATGNPISKWAKLRNTSPLDSPIYKVYVGELTADYTDANGNLMHENAKKGMRDFYCEGIGGTPRPVVIDTLPDANSTDVPFQG